MSKQARKQIRMVLAAATLMMTPAGAAPAQAQGAQAQSDIAQAVRVRQELMEENGRIMGRVLTPMMRAENQQPWSQQTAVQAMTTIRDAAGRIPGLFPPGSGPQFGPDIYALPSIWERKAEFDAAAQRLGERAAALLALAEANNEAGFRQAFPTFFREACVSCHLQFGAPGVPGVPRP
jgi:cytochrome c556